MFLTIEGMGQSLILIGSAFQESEMYLSSQGFSFSMLSLARTLLPIAVCSQTKYTALHIVVSRDTGVSRSQGTTQILTLELNTALPCVPKAKQNTNKQNTQNNMKMCALPHTVPAPFSHGPVCLVHPGSLCFGDLAIPLTFL